MSVRHPKWIGENMAGFKHLLAVLDVIGDEEFTRIALEYLLDFADKYAIIIGYNGYVRIDFKSETEKAYVATKVVGNKVVGFGHDRKFIEQHYDYQVQKALAE